MGKWEQAESPSLETLAKPACRSLQDVGLDGQPSEG